MSANSTATQFMPSKAMQRYDVFISYSRKDLDYAVRLERILTQNGLKVFRDSSRLEIGDHVDIVIPEAHHQSAAVVVLWSEHSASSAWVYDEAISAVYNGKRYYPLMVPGFDPARIPNRLAPLHAGQFQDVIDDPRRLVETIRGVIPPDPEFVKKLREVREALQSLQELKRPTNVGVGNTVGRWDWLWGTPAEKQRRRRFRNRYSC